MNNKWKNWMLFIVCVLLVFVPVFYNLFFENTFVFEWGFALLVSIIFIAFYPSYHAALIFVIITNLAKFPTEIYVNGQTLSSLALASLIGSSIMHTIILFTVTYFRIQQKKLESKLKNDSTLDPLTNLHNRRYIEEIFQEMESNYHRIGKPFSFILFDVDNFKRFNDTYGHRFGDNILVVFANILKEHFRAKDVIARFGGEEFAILLPDTSVTEAYKLAESLRVTIENSQVMNNKEIVNVTVSAGVSEFKGQSFLSFYEKTDELLYRAKKLGRNQVCK